MQAEKPEQKEKIINYEYVKKTPKSAIDISSEQKYKHGNKTFVSFELLYNRIIRDE